MSSGAFADIPPAETTDVRSLAREHQIAVALTAITLVGLAIRLWRIGHQSFWYDESFTVQLVHHSPGKMFGLFPKMETTPPLYYCVAWVWVRIFGFGEAGLRSLSAVVGTATIPVAYAIGARLMTRRIALTASALVAANPLLIWYSQEARSYSTLVFTSSLSLLAFAWALQRPPTWRRVGSWGLAAGVALCTHYYASIVLVPEALVLLWWHRGDRRVWASCGFVAAVGLALLPLLLLQLHLASWVAGYPLLSRLGQIAPQFVLGTGAPARTWLKLAGALAIATSLALLISRAAQAERRGAMLIGGIGGAGFLITLALVVIGKDFLITRNIIAVLVPAILLIAGGLGARRAGWLGPAGTAVLCAVGLTAAIAVSVDIPLQRPDWRGLVRVLGPPPAGAHARLLLFQHYYGWHNLSIITPVYAFRRSAWVDEVDVIAIRAIERGGWFCWWGSACNLPPSHISPQLQIPGMARLGPQEIYHQFVIQRFRSERPILVSRAMLNRALKRDHPRYFMPLEQHLA